MGSGPLPDRPAGGAVVGVEVPVWTEFVPDAAKLGAQLLPRLPALAEVAWTPQRGRDWRQFAARLAAQPRHWEAAGWRWTRAAGVDWQR
ncbi:family 20 glycosylhydrolase [Streptacidiphilus monticola]